MREFRKQFDLPATKLSLSDVRILDRIVRDGLPFTPNSLEFVFRAGDSSYSACSLDELMTQDLPESIDGFEINAYGWTDKGRIDRSVAIHLGRMVSYCHIYSLDEVWFKGKMQQLTEYFQIRRSWYSSLHHRFPFIVGILQGLFLAELFYSLSSRHLMPALASLVMNAILWIGIRAFLRGNLFPVIKIRLDGRPRRINWEAIAVISTAIGAIGAIAGVVIQLFKK